VGVTYTKEAFKKKVRDQKMAGIKKKGQEESREEDPAEEKSQEVHSQKRKSSHHFTKKKGSAHNRIGYDHKARQGRGFHEAS